MKNNNLPLNLFLLACFSLFWVFNFSVTDYALKDLFGPIFPWFLPPAFVGIDFFALSGLFTESGLKITPGLKRVFYLWLTGILANAYLIFHGVFVAIKTHPELGGTLAIAVFVTTLTLIIRVLLTAICHLSTLARLAQTLTKGNL